MGMIRGKRHYILDTEELQEWCRILEEPVHCERGESGSSDRELKEELFGSESCPLAVMGSELGPDSATQVGLGVRLRLPGKALPAGWRDVSREQMPSSDYILSVVQGRYLDELPESSEPLKENFKANQGCCDQIPTLLGGVRDLVTVLSTNIPATTTAISSETFGVLEAARRLGCSTKTVHKLCHEKLLAFHWVGNKRRFRPEYVSQFFEAQSGTTKTQKPLGVDEKRGSRLRFSGSSAAGRPKKGGEKRSTKGTDNGTETEILASIRERMREWD